jgi:hypothetical protein
VFTQSAKLLIWILIVCLMVLMVVPILIPEFLRDLVVTPPIEAENHEAESDVPISVKRNLS